MDLASFGEFVGHIVGEIRLSSVMASLNSIDFNLLKNAHDSIHEFADFPSLCSPRGDSKFSKSAFLTQRMEVVSHAHRSLIEALSGFYNIAYIILRSTLELVFRSAFWEMLAHKVFRRNAEVLKKVQASWASSNTSFLDWFENILRENPMLVDRLERNSVSIFDLLYVFLEDREMDALMVKLKPRIIIEQLSVWGVLNPVRRSEIFKIYNELSREVHVVPHKTDVERQIFYENVIPEVGIIPKELERFLKFLHQIMDMATTIEVNILSDWISQQQDKTKLKKKLATWKKLKLEHGTKALERLI
ncbi:MAG: hypothetical protein ACP6IP_01910 [Candidatus Njordarchaeia archaeon]